MSGESSPTLVTVVVPTYNSVEYLEEAFASIDAQTWPALEVVISDDGSRDETLELAARFAERSRHPVRVLSTPRNLGPAGNFRHCIEQARGEFVKFLIPDDLLEPEAVERLLAPLREHPDAVLATSRRRIIDSARNPLPEVHASLVPFEHDEVIDGIAMGDAMLEANANYVGEPSTVLIRRSACEPATAFTFAGHEYRVLADMSMWLQLCSRGSVAFISEPMSSFRRHANQDQHSIRLVMRGSREWAHLAKAAHRHGFLQRPHALRRALVDAKVAAGGRLIRRAAHALVRR